MALEFNPFTEQINVKYFVGREYQLKQFRGDLSGLRGGVPNHQYIAGLNGTGKTSYLAKLVEIAEEEGFLAVMPTLDAESLSRGHVMTIMRALVRDAERMLKGNAPNLLDDWDKGKDSKHFALQRTDDLKSDRLQQDFETLAGFLKKAGVPGAVVCIDEGQRIDGRAMSALKNSLQKVNSYMVVISLRLASDSGGIVEAGKRWLETKAANEAEGDIGAARFYVTGVPIGPFDSEEEASQCILRRLENNVIQFDNEVVERIGRINDRVPKGMISLANSVYNEAKKCGVTQVQVATLNQTFRDVFRREVKEAETLLASLSVGAKTALKGILSIGQPANAATIASHLYPGTPPEVQANIADGLQGSLDRISQESGFCLKTQDRYEIPNPVHAYAFELALGIA